MRLCHRPANHHALEFIMMSTHIYLRAVRLLLAHCVLLTGPLLYAATGVTDEALNSCLQEQVLYPENNAQTVGQLRARCAALLTPRETGVERIMESTAQTNIMQPYSFDGDLRSSFVQGYKNNYISLGSMRNEDGSTPFSGKTLDIKFELGMKFGLFPDIDGLEPLSPLKFGYSQRSWWDISEDSAPFKEHNYNPEIFWDFTEALARPSSTPRWHIFDLVGIEHQSNGLDAENSRSWDRIYATRTLRSSEAWSWTFKYWQAINLGDYNEDIEDYLGTAEITTHLDLNNWVRVNLKTLLGRKSDKLSYQLDLIVPMSRWINSRFFMSYYNGYGEALISYNKKSSSFRAGFYFPLGF
jgi:phospholipase A1